MGSLARRVYSACSVVLLLLPHYQKTRHALYTAMVTLRLRATWPAEATEYLPMILPNLLHSPRRSWHGKKVFEHLLHPGQRRSVADFLCGDPFKRRNTRKDKISEGLCQEGENDQIVARLLWLCHTARLGKFEKFVGGSSARGCAHVAEPFGNIRRSSHLDVYKMVRACCDYCLGFTVLQCYAECHLSPNHPFISAGYGGVQSLLPQIEQTLNLFCLGWMASQHCRFQIFVHAVICMRGLPEVISIRLGA